MSQFPKDFRPAFDDFLKKPETYPKCNPCTYNIVKTMHDRMVANKVPMSEGHFRAATSSLEGGDSICSFLTKENSHVINSTGQGFVYNAGKGFHTLLSWFPGSKPG